MARVKETEELSKRLSEVKDSWYATANDIEGLVGHATKPALLGKSLSKISAGIEGFAEGVQDIGKVGEQLIPGLWKELKAQETEIVNGLENFYREVEADFATIEQQESVVPKLRALRKRHKSKSTKLRELEKLGEEIGEEHAGLSGPYEKELSQINEEAEKAVKETKRRFLKEVGSLFEGFEIMDKKEKRRVSMDELFNRFAKEPGYYRRLDVTSKGIGGIMGKSSDREVRHLFLEYKSRDVAKVVAPVIKEHKSRLAKLEERGKRIKELERAMGEVKVEKENALKALQKLEAEIKGLEDGGSEIERRFSTLDQVIAKRDAYLERFNEVNDRRKKLYVAIEDAVEGYVPVEKDIEKRELKEEAKRQRDELKSLKGSIKNLTMEKGRLEETHREAGATIKKLEEETEKLKAELQDLTAKYKEARKEIAARDKELKKSQKEHAKLEARYTKAEGELEELNTQIDALVSIRQKRPLDGNARPKTEEEKEIGKKIGALRGREVE